MSSPQVALRYCGDIVVAIRAYDDREFKCCLRAGTRESAEVIAFAPPTMPDDDLYEPNTLDDVARMAIRTVNLHCTMMEEDVFGRIVKDGKGDPLISRTEEEAWGPD